MNEYDINQANQISLTNLLSEYNFIDKNVFNFISRNSFQLSWNFALFIDQIFLNDLIILHTTFSFYVVP